ISRPVNAGAEGGAIFGCAGAGADGAIFFCTEWTTTVREVAGALRDGAGRGVAGRAGSGVTVTCVTSVRKSTRFTRVLLGGAGRSFFVLSVGSFFVVVRACTFAQARLIARRTISGRGIGTGAV